MHAIHAQNLDDIVRQLDAVDIRSPEPPYACVGRIGLVGNFYLPPHRDRGYRERLGVFVDHFISQQRSHFRWHTVPVADGSGGLSVTALTEARFAASARAWDAAVSFSGMSGSSAADLPHPESVPGTHQIQFYLPGAPNTRHAGHVRFCLPFAWERDQPGPGLRQWVQLLCEQLEPLHGCAGMGFVYPADYASAYSAGASGAFHAGALRFPGIDATMPLIGEGELQALPSLNWLTCVSDGLLARLGGRAAVMQALPEPPFEVFAFSNGLLVQAGPAPLSGDRTLGQMPAPYQQLYRVLRRLMMDSVENPFVLDGVSADEPSQYRAYAQRFAS